MKKIFILFKLEFEIIFLIITDIYLFDYKVCEIMFIFIIGNGYFKKF